MPLGSVTWRQPWTLIGSGGAEEAMAMKQGPSAHHRWLHKNSEFIPSRPRHPSYSGYPNISRYEWGSRQPSRLHTTQELGHHPYNRSGKSFWCLLNCAAHTALCQPWQWDQAASIGGNVTRCQPQWSGHYRVTDTWLTAPRARDN